MANPRVSPAQQSDNEVIDSGHITKIHLENFMCHSNLDIEFGRCINFITGQNGSGKSAILTALCVAFGCRARGTQRANTLKDFIKTGCSYALVQVEIKNKGPEAYKPEIFGDIIVVERRITESSSTTTLKNRQGKRVCFKREDLREVIEHFNIDVENPCMIMSQDKSREFLNSGSAKDKFKATLLQRVDDLLKGIDTQLSDAAAQVNHLEESLRPVLKELDELHENIKSMKVVEEISLKIQLVRRKLAWAWVYDVERKLDEKSKEIEKLKGRIPRCKTRIDEQHSRFEELSDKLAKKKSHMSILVEKASELKRMRDELQNSYSTARKEKLVLEGDRDRETRLIQKTRKRIELLEQQIHQFHEQRIRDTQAEENEIKTKLKELEVDINEAKENCQRLKAEEDDIAEKVVLIENEIRENSEKINEAERIRNGISRAIRETRNHQKNKITAFGADKVLSLLRAIDDNKHEFRSPPIGPIGSHLKLEKIEWSTAVESAVGRIFDSFIVTDHRDSLTLRALARNVRYNNLHIIIHDFSRKRLEIPQHMLPQTHHPTVFSVLHTDNDVVHNVLIDVGTAEQQVFVRDYAVGKAVVFNPSIKNVKEAYTNDGTRMFQRGKAQTVLPPHPKLRGRLCASYDEEITKLESEESLADESVKESRALQEKKYSTLKDLQRNFHNKKRKRKDEEQKMMPKEYELQDLRISLAAVAGAAPASDADELRQEIYKLHEEIKEQQTLLEKLEIRVDEAGVKAEDLNVSFKNISESIKLELEVLSAAEEEMVMIEKDIHSAEATKKHYQELMVDKVVPELKKAETEYAELEHVLKENHRKASIIAPQSEIEELGVKESNPEQLSAELNKWKDRLARESHRFPDSIEDLRMMFEKKQRKISRKQQTYKAFKEKLEVLEKALEMRWVKFQRNAELLIRELTWRFNGHLLKKGIRGEIKVNAKEQTLSIEVTMPQDASNSTVRDTRGLSGGERSFSTLCFALTIHGMAEAPFRAMDEFDVFMDAVSRKISLDALVDFALEQNSQWIFITPHDISMVKNHERIKKQQMAAPRG